MQTRVLKTFSFAALTVSAVLCWAAAGRAETLTFNNTPASNVVAEMSKRYGVSIVLRGNVNANTPVTLSVDDPDTPGGRLQAVSDLANALGLDFQKVYVVSKIDPGTTVPEVKIDSNGPVVFSSSKVSARDAIQTVAAVDGAIALISGVIDGDVTLPGSTMNASSAAALIAKQTQTVWKAYYGMYRRGQGPTRLNDVVVGHTSSGQPITVLPLLTYRNPVITGLTTSSTADLIMSLHTPVTGVPNVVSIPTDAANVFATVNPMENSAFGYNPYAYGNPYSTSNPYANPYGYGYVAPNGTVSAPGYVYSPGSGVSPAIPGTNAPPTIAAPGVGVTVVPNTTVTVVP